MGDIAPPGRDALSTAYPERLANLAGLLPAVAPLTLLAQPLSSSPDLWDQVRHDPALVLLAVRQPVPPDTSSPLSARLAEPAFLDNIRSLLDSEVPFVSWAQEAIRPVYTAALTIARLSLAIARFTGRVDPERAWVGGMLAPLGWLAVSAVSPSRVAACLADSARGTDAEAVQQHHWGIDAAALARRLGRRWGLPGWLSAIIGRLHLPPELVSRNDADIPLFHAVRAAVGLSRGHAVDLGLVGVGSTEASANLLGLPPGFRPPLDEIHSAIWENPRGVALLPQLLAAAADNRRLRASPQAAGLEREIDDLHRALEGQVRGEAGRLHRAKLAALAEFAAGAGHEINNPLAVISGQAQYLLGHAPEWFAAQGEDGPAKALHTIIGQTRRVHHMLRDLMQFARPAVPAPCWFDLPSLLAEVAASLSEAAGGRQVRIDLNLPERLQVWADAGQVRTVVTSLLRNAIEAAPAEGWARLAIEQTATNAVTVAVEDSGPGPDPAHRPFLFDPFFSGRSAGRGRGLGLPLAWRLATLQGGEVVLDSARSQDDGPTRFVLRLPAGPDTVSERPAA